MEEAPPPPARWKAIAVVVAMVVAPWIWLLFPYLGNVGQTLAVIGPVLFAGVVVLLVVLFIVRRRWLVAVGAVVWLLAGAAMILTPRVPQSFAAPRDPVTIVAANLHFENSTPVDAARDVIACHADVVVVSEGTLRSEPVISAAYPFHANSAYHNAGYSEYVASRYRLRRLAVPHALGQAVVVEVDAPRPFVLIGVHLPRPGINLPYLHGNFSFAAQGRSLAAVKTVARRERLPVVVAGDLNLSDRTVAYQHLVAGRRDAMRADWAGTTYRPFPFSLLALRIDHVIIDRSWCAAHPTRFHPTGSDHLAVQVAVGPCR